MPTGNFVAVVLAIATAPNNASRWKNMIGNYPNENLLNAE